MLRLIFLIYIFLFTPFTVAASGLYQVDVILFTHGTTTENNTTIMGTEMTHAIPLRTAVTQDHIPYHLQPHALSHLNKSYWALNNQENYHLLCHYTWLQPSSNQQSIALPPLTQSGWNVTGTIRVRQSNYYLLDTNLTFSKENNPNNTFVLAQKQRLKPGSIYYLDHPTAGMLITVRKV